MVRLKVARGKRGIHARWNQIPKNQKNALWRRRAGRPLGARRREGEGSGLRHDGKGFGAFCLKREGKCKTAFF